MLTASTTLASTDLTILVRLCPEDQLSKDALETAKRKAAGAVGAAKENEGVGAEKSKAKGKGKGK